MINYKITGLPELLKKMDPQIMAKPLRDFFNKTQITIAGRAKENAPVDTGRLRSSLTGEVDSSTLPLWASVGTNVEYAPMMEFGTGTAGEGGGSPHFPPGPALDLWASRHGFASGWQVAIAIGRRGGLKPRRYLRKAFEDSLGDIKRYLDDAGDAIKKAWEG